MKTREVTSAFIWDILEEVFDPEIPVLSVVDLGVVRSIKAVDNDKWHIKITPTYTGCPATKVMEYSILKRLEKEHIEASVEVVLSPAWTTDWMSESGKEKLQQFGIAPPQEGGDVNALFGRSLDIICPHCKSTDTTCVSEFGSTACKSLYRCNHCHEPFDYFKCHK